MSSFSSWAELALWFSVRAMVFAGTPVGLPTVSFDPRDLYLGKSRRKAGVVRQAEHKGKKCTGLPGSSSAAPWAALHPVQGKNAKCGCLCMLVTTCGPLGRLYTQKKNNIQFILFLCIFLAYRCL